MPGNRKKSKAAKKRAIKARNDADNSNWLEAIENYIKETQTRSLKLESIILEMHEVQSVLKFLCDSQVDELDLNCKFHKNGMKLVAPLLTQTKIKKFNYSWLGLTNVKDFLLLLDILKDTELCVPLDWNFKLNYDEALQCISYLQRSKLTIMNSKLFHHFPSVGLTSLIQNYLNTSITCLNLASCQLSVEDFISLIRNLNCSSVTNLDLSQTKILPEALEDLSQKLAETKIEKLNLGSNDLGDDQLNILMKGLVNSKVTVLNLCRNRLSNLNSFFTKLKDTQIAVLDLSENFGLQYEKSVLTDCMRCSMLTSLNLSCCDLRDEAGEGLMESLRFSSVTKLDISGNFVGSLTVKKFAENAKDINLIDLDIFLNPLPLDAFLILGKCLTESKLTHINVSEIRSEPPLEVNHLLSFLKLTEGSSICHIDMRFYYVTRSSAVGGEQNMLVNTTFTELNLNFCYFGNNFLKLVTHLKFTAITNLMLSNNNITDDDAVALAKILKETQIRRLNLHENCITSQGAKALALSLKDSNLLYLDLSLNDIENDGLESLAENAKDTFVSMIDVSSNLGKRVLPVDTVLWQNKISVHRLVSVFKQIAPQSNKEFCFDENIMDLNITACLEKYMEFYKTVIDKPQAISVLLEEKILPHSREQMSNLLFEEFPLQFSRFVACRIEADVTEHVTILEKAEGMGLTALVESLLLNRPIYMLDEEQGILHPQVYKLLLKYKQPVCNLAVEPRGVVKIIEYFTEHADVEGASDLINLLNNAKVC